MLIRVIPSFVLLVLSVGGFTVRGQELVSSGEIRIEVRLSELPPGRLYDSVVREVVQRYGLAVANSGDDVAELREALEDALEKQYDHFALLKAPDKTSLVPADESIRKLMQRRRDSREDFIELRLTILEHRAAGDAVPGMIAESFRDLCIELDLHVRPDHSIHEGALDPERCLMAIEFPHICCGGCVEAVRNAFTAMDGVNHVEVDFDSKICQFSVGRDVDLEPKLNELAESRKVFEDWSVVWSADGSDE